MGLVVGPLAGAMVVRKPMLAALCCVAIVIVVLLEILGDRALPWMVVAFVIVPWYPFAGGETSPPPLVKQVVLCAAIVAAPVVPWLWGVAARSSRTPRSRFAPLMGMMFLSLFVLVYLNKTSFSSLIISGTIGFLFAGVTFLCARRNAHADDWLAPCFAGLCVLVLLGFAALAQAPGERIGGFTGHPITYGALLAGLLPPAVVWAARRSSLLAFVVAAAAIAMEILSQSRSSWVATSATILLVVLVLARYGNVRKLGTAVLSAALVIGLGLSIGPLHEIISERLDERQNRTSESVVHRTWSVGYAMERIREHPAFGVGRPGFAGEQSNDLTGIGAVDNGYLSITVDLGLLGLLAVLVPIAFALRALAGALIARGPPVAELSLALGIFALATVAIFYDSFYWAQIDLLMFAFGGVLSARLGAAPGLFRRGGAVQERNFALRAAPSPRGFSGGAAS